MRQLTKREAINFSKSEKWKDWTAEEITAFQLLQKRLCVPMDVFHESIEVALKRPVFTHEFADFQRLRDELLGKGKKATLQEIMALIPQEKRIIVSVDRGELK